MLFSDRERALNARDRSCRHRLAAGRYGITAEDETTGVDFTQHAETAYAEAVHGHQPSRRPGSLGAFGVSEQQPETAEEG